ncbi:MAG: hypothetical protein IH853_12315 [Bacteroidetes bacterium]|nr:hypothetical protein [Bacteroidota bacterium]
MRSNQGPARIIWTVPILVGLLITACDSNNNAAPDPDNDDSNGLLFDGSWTVGWPQLGHDGKPYESERFIVYSEMSSQASRQSVANIAEEALDDILSILGVTYDEFTFLPSYTSRKIHIMADWNQMAQSGLAYRDGFIMRALDSPRYQSAGYTQESYRRVLQHELTHVTEFLLIGDPTRQQANDVWLREGFANYGARHHRIQTVDELDAWQAKNANVPGGGNPIGIHVWANFPQSVIANNTTIEYYGFFELASRYLLDTNGNGTTIDDLKAMYEDLGNGMLFWTSFENRFGMTISYYEANWWELMRTYLASSQG